MAEEFDGIAVIDRLKIADRIARYSWAIDSGDMEAYLGCFDAAGYLEHPLADGSPGRFEGHEGIRRFIGENFRRRPQQSYGHQHQFGAVVMSREGEAVRVEAYCTIYRHEFHRRYWPAGPSWRMGTWHALLVPREGSWKIAALEVRMWTDTALGAGTALADRPPGTPGTREA